MNKLAIILWAIGLLRKRLERRVVKMRLNPGANSTLLKLLEQVHKVIVFVHDSVTLADEGKEAETLQFWKDLGVAQDEDGASG